MNSRIRAFTLLFLSLLGVACGSWNPQYTGGPAVEGQKAPDFSFSQSPDKTAFLRDYRGRVVLINFWATWCPPCLDEIPSLNALYEAMDSNRLVILAFSVDQSWDPVRRFLSQNHYVLPVYDDFNRKVSTLYGTHKFPETYIINKKGKVAFKIIGETDWMASEMLSYLRQLMAEPD
jgi:cytochrome c biogenesis protein CcmG/thiol:disulfide interchange protein DsbE